MCVCSGPVCVVCLCVADIRDHCQRTMREAERIEELQQETESDEMKTRKNNVFQEKQCKQTNKQMYTDMQRRLMSSYE